MAFRQRFQHEPMRINFQSENNEPERTNAPQLRADRLQMLNYKCWTSMLVSHSYATRKNTYLTAIYSPSILPKCPGESQKFHTKDPFFEG